MDNFELKKTICKIISCNDKTELVNSFNEIASADWDYIYNFLLSYNLCPLFYSVVKQNDLNVSSGITNKLQQNYIASSSQYLKRAHDIKNILSEFNKENIDAIPLKGIYLAEKYYKNPVLRPMCDIDLLVKSEDVKRSLEILDKIGFIKKTEIYDYDLYINNLRHIPQCFSKNNIPLELHFTLFADDDYYLKNVKVDLSNVWSTCSETSLLNQKSFEMSIENLILHLCIHIAGDKFTQKILHLLDVYLILKCESINWQLLISKSRDWKAEKILYCVLLALHKLFNLKVNSLIQQRLEIIEDVSEIGYVLEKIILSDLSLQNDKKISNFKYSTFKNKLNYLKYSMFSDKVICTIYGISDKSLKKYFYYILRFSHLLKTYLITFFNLYILKKSRNIKDISKCSNFFDKWVNN